MTRVDRISYEPADIKLDIHYTAKSGMFRCTYADKTYEHKDVAVLKHDVLGAIKAAYALEWFPVIEMTQPGHMVHTRAHLSLCVERKYIGFHPTLGYKQCHWTAQPEQRLAVSRTFVWCNDKPFDLPASKEVNFDRPAYQESFATITTWLAYTEETWLKLGEITTYIQIAKRALQTHLVDDAGVTRALDVCHSLFDHYSTPTQDEPSQAGGDEC